MDTSVMVNVMEDTYNFLEAPSTEEFDEHKQSHKPV